MIASKPKYPGIRITTNGNQLVALYTEARIAEAGVFYPITPSTEMGEMFEFARAKGQLNVFGQPTLAIETEGEHAAQGGAIAQSVTGKRTVNFTSGQGIVYGVEQYYHAPGKLSTMVLEVAARALTKHALNVHCGHDDIYAALDTGWIMMFAKDAQQAADQAVILRKVTEKALTPGMNIQDGFLTSHLERTFLKHESELLREFLGSPDDIVECPTEAQRKLFGPTRRRIPKVIDLHDPALIGPVQNQEHYMNGVVARRNNFVEPILGFIEEAYNEFGNLTGRHYSLVSEYRNDDAEITFLSLGSAAENIEAAVDHLRETRGVKVGSIHVNVIRPFPQAAIVDALRGKKACIILERTDEPFAGDNPLAREVRAALTKSYIHPGFPHRDGLPTIEQSEVPRNYSGVYGLGSRDFRPEHIIGAYEFVAEGRARQDGKTAADGVTFFNLGVDHPYSVCSDETPSLLPKDAIAVRLHSIGGWGMITTGKNLAEIIGELGTYVAQRDKELDENGNPKEVVHVSANPKYGSEKKGAPTEYFLTAAPERVRVNCDLKHVNVVLCCDPKAFTHINPIKGLVEGGAFIWESAESPEQAWQRIPQKYRQEIIDKKIRIYTLPGFKIAKGATKRPDLQLRMQGNSFLGAFFKVSPFLDTFGIDEDHFKEVVRAQYNKKFGKFGEAVVDSNMEVMIQGGSQLREVPYGPLEAPDHSAVRGEMLLPNSDCGGACGCAPQEGQPEGTPMYRTSAFDKEFRAGLGYDQPASPLSAVGVMASATGATSSKYGARRETPKYFAENCTQCMECITSCPDTALPNTAQDLQTILRTAVENYVRDPEQRALIAAAIPDVDQAIRDRMKENAKKKEGESVRDLVMEIVRGEAKISATAADELDAILKILPLAYLKVPAVFFSLERKEAGMGGIFSIFVSDLCKGCGLCVEECGDHDALRMVEDTEEYNAEILSATEFLRLLPDTNQKYLGLYNDETPEDSRPAAWRNHMMVNRNYDALVSGDGACAGCGEKPVLHALASVTEAYMRPVYHKKADRMLQKVAQLKAEGAAKLEALAQSDAKAYGTWKRIVSHVVMGLGGDSNEDTDARLAAHGEISDAELVEAICLVLEKEAFNHKNLQTIDGRLANGMSVMAMGAHTGCNTVYGSTPPNNPHPYPWLNSLFQDGATISWMMGESFMTENARRSVIPERMIDHLMDGDLLDEATYFNYTHFTDALMTDQEIKELPKVWCVGGDGGMGDIGFQNVSKVILQNRPNVKLLMLDTQVYSNTGGQNSDHSPMTGGFDMNQAGAASQGKLNEMKNITECFLNGHGSPYLAQVSMADSAKLYNSLLEGLQYRGTAFFQCYTTCQPEHGVADNMATNQATLARESRCLPEFVFNPQLGESYQEALSLKGNKNPDRDWWQAKYSDSKDSYSFTIAHWACTEARFRQHIKKAAPEEVERMEHLEDVLLRVTQQDIVHRRFIDPKNRAYIPDFGVYIYYDAGNGKRVPMKMSRQMVLFNVERRKAWRMLQSHAGVVNKDYEAQKALLAQVDKGEISLQDLKSKGRELLVAE
ncbi:2-oxoacid:acceptor oxidoreductase family protein [Pelagicoccus enzymogenes]|uniref:2-oxoacid:acceptor oxidoreductase family protein n=1 Tax=Pelagicoccus enzymogenes TaxID=2773457 RepID=UPI00280F652A|nr:2-oxoacid:acceptor oxidoreductase family protein [Pelagicoccus enzymogenes]MDQ8199299.1 2-oxoacid:acceptor oxidoreductase family protein [Pelagicoccus enzymogenes]